MKNFLLIFILVVFTAWPVNWERADPVIQASESEKPAATEIIIKPSKTYQTIDGFGASDAWRAQFVGKNWPLEKRKAIADLLFSQELDKEGNPEGIGLSMWRFYIGAGSTEQGEDSGIANEWRRAPSFLDAEGNWDWSKFEGQRWFLNAAKERGVNQFLAFTISAPVFMTKNGKAFSSSGKAMNIQEDKMDDYADFLVEIVDHFEKQESITFDYLSPINEPQWDWETGKQEGTGATNTDMHDFTKLISERLTDRGLSTEITLGEAGRLKFLNGETDKPERDDQIREFFDPAAENYVGDYPKVKPLISGHSYYSVWPVDSLISERQELASRLEEIDPDLGYWHSEYCILKANDDITGGWNRDLGIETALYVARIIHHDMTIPNAKSWQWWTALSQFNFKDGLIYLDDGGDGVRSLDDPQMESLKYDGNFRDSKLLWALGNYSRFIRPGMKRIAVENKSDLMQQAAGLMASAYVDEDTDKVTAVFVNYGEEEKPVDLALGSDGGAALAGAQLETYTTSSAMDLGKQMADAEKLVIPARSVVTAILDIE
jgi:O-glycosyl hydrolase